MDTRNAGNDDAGSNDSLKVIQFGDIIRQKIEKLTEKANVHKHLALESVSLQAKTFHTTQNEVLSAEIGKLKDKLRHLKNQGFVTIHHDVFSIDPFNGC